MYLRLVFIHLWLILSARAGLYSHVLGHGGVWTSGVGGCERLATGPGWGDVADLAGQAGSTTSAGWVGSTVSVGRVGSTVSVGRVGATTSVTGLVRSDRAASWAR